MKLVKMCLERAATFVAQLYRFSLDARHSWQRAERIGCAIGLQGTDLEQALVDAEAAGLIMRRTDHTGLVLLTEAGRGVAEGMPDARWA